MAIIICPICGKERKIKPSQTDRIFTCGDKKCRSIRMHQRFKDDLSKQLGQPVKEALYQAYIVERKSHRQICKAWRTSNHTLIDLMKEFDIEPRHGSKAIKTQWENNDERRKQQSILTSKRMKAYYANGGEYTSQRPDVRRKISEAKKRNNWMQGRTGSKHHNWQGGKIWWRGKEWNDLKEEIRKRDGYHCQCCGMTDEQCIAEYSNPLQVHHIVPYRLSHDNSPENLKTLCNKCHSQTDHEFYWLL